MINLNKATAERYWRAAAAAEVGVRFTVNSKDLDRLKILMYKVRQELNDESLSNIGLYIAPGREEVWLVKKALEAP